MKTVFPLMVVLTLLLAACSRDAQQRQEVPLAAPEPAADLVDELARDPDRLKEVRRLCREDPAAIDEELCVAAAKATRQRFMGEGKAKYTPEPAALPETTLPATQDE